MGFGVLEGLFSWRSPLTAIYPNLSRQSLLASRLCTEAQLTSPEFLQWVARLQKRSMDETGHLKHLHRKLWEWCFICETLQNSGMLAPRKRGLGFAVGKEPLAACFAGQGCEIVATDLDTDQARETGWSDSLQHAHHLEDLYRAHLCDETAFQERVSFRSVDMNDIPPDITGFDFVWSSCAFEHLGSIEKGQAFIYRMMDCLKPGGIAVHTTEFNLSSNKETLAEGVTVLFRRRDINAIAKNLRKRGHYIRVDYRTGDQPADQIIDLPPYAVTPHLKLQVFQFVVTSIGLVIVKGRR
jgi:hypothetical protein